MTTTAIAPASRAAVLAEHGLTDCVTMQLPPLRARNHGEAGAALKARRAALLDHAEHLVWLAEAFADVPEVVDVLIADARAALAQAGRCVPGVAR